jgi:hypothetical protein
VYVTPDSSVFSTCSLHGSITTPLGRGATITVQTAAPSIFTTQPPSASSSTTTLNAAADTLSRGKIAPCFRCDGCGGNIGLGAHSGYAHKECGTCVALVNDWMIFLTACSVYFAWR